MYEIDLNSPIIFLWAGLFSNNKDIKWRHKESLHTENFEIIIPIQNKVEINVNGKEYTVSQYECFIIPPKASIKGSSRINGELSFYWFHFLSVYQLITSEKPSFQKGLVEIANRKRNTHLNNKIILPDRFTINHPDKVIVLINQLLNNTNIYHYSERNNDYFLILLLLSLSDDFLNQQASQKIIFKKPHLLLNGLELICRIPFHLVQLQTIFK